MGALLRVPPGWLKRTIERSGRYFEPFRAGDTIDLGDGSTWTMNTKGADALNRWVDDYRPTGHRRHPNPSEPTP